MDIINDRSPATTVQNEAFDFGLGSIYAVVVSFVITTRMKARQTRANALGKVSDKALVLNIFCTE